MAKKHHIVKESLKGLRTELPPVDSEIDDLIDSYLKSDDFKKHKRRYGR